MIQKVIQQSRLHQIRKKYLRKTYLRLKKKLNRHNLGPVFLLRWSNSSFSYSKQRSLKEKIYYLLRNLVWLKSIHLKLSKKNLSRMKYNQLFTEELVRSMDLILVLRSRVKKWMYQSLRMKVPMMIRFLDSIRPRLRVMIHKLN